MKEKVLKGVCIQQGVVGGDGRVGEVAELVLEKSVLVAPSEKVLVVAARAAAQMVGHGAGAAPSSHQHTNTLFLQKNQI